MKLFKIYENINQNRDEWCYYRQAYLNDIFPFKKQSDDNALSFIKSYLDAGGKRNLYAKIDNESKNFDKFENVRAQHTLSTFMLGIYFYNKLNLEGIFKRAYSQIQDKHDWLFMWYLTCLYHDIGYIFENDSKDHINKSLKGFLPREADLRVCRKLDNYKLGLNYFKYRRKDCGVIDHGVVGGFRLYSILYRAYRKVLNVAENCIYNGLLYSEEFLQLIGHASEAIIRHNMWNIDDAEIREKYHLEALNNTKISLKEEPITFLLGLCDTIEPLKHFRNIEPNFVLDHIDVDITNNKAIKINIDSPLLEEEYYKKIIDLPKWLDVGVRISDNGNVCCIEFTDSKKDACNDTNEIDEEISAAWENMILIGINK
ncbi:MAG: hypothetical protein LUF82_04160 [Clostridia bacterium]|nr:hypothetical protein [Clostridia bacterium]